MNCFLEHVDPDITLRLSQARDGDKDAFGKLFDFYIDRLRLHLRRRLTTQDRAEGFEEDLASETMAGVWHDITEGRFGHVKNREELWCAMICVARSRAMDRKKYLRRKKRLFGLAERLATLFNRRLDSNLATDEFDLFEEWEQFVTSLPSDQYREIIRLKMKGLDTKDIADRFEILPRCVLRKLKTIRGMWEEFAMTKNNS